MIFFCSHYLQFHGTHVDKQGKVTLSGADVQEKHMHFVHAAPPPNVNERRERRQLRALQKMQVGGVNSRWGYGCV
jgi:hypothetical protein